MMILIVMYGIQCDKKELEFLLGMITEYHVWASLKMEWQFVLDHGIVFSKSGIKRIFYVLLFYYLLLTEKFCFKTSMLSFFYLFKNFTLFPANVLLFFKVFF